MKSKTLLIRTDEIVRDHRYGGADQWQLEGVQAGGIRSGGIYGLWTHCDHDESGPIGPFCYFPKSLCEMRGAFQELENSRFTTTH
jgi:hypothetical protein